ncbi:MAG: RluA family pseudouridine synthase [Litorivicinaceae bacterium]|nr:RluA family pseudouridine synthase [Litorivicinaceae bacterium]MDF1783617.1 RluA family pseudouridine synthase [Litorivicinaceae bacterium]NBR75389.1 RluA family pseudouridine synthase [Gammaproteobacteria bacterium]HAB77463.1 23S rRNA pseudouridine(955/2504/2580) synthase [Gammaproteobacteria bacterium]
MEKKVQWVTVDESKEGQRLDNFLSNQLKGLPKGRIYKMIRTGEVRINKGRCKPDSRVSAGDIVRIPPVDLAPTKEAIAHRGIQMKLSDALLYEDEDVLVLNKPSGLAVHGGSGLSTGLIEQLRLARPNEKFLELVHRLDRETSGCLLVARRPSALRRLHQQLRDQDKGLQKRYLALVAGKWPQYLVDVEAPLEKFERGGERIVQVTERGKPSHTRIRPLEVLDGCTLVEAEPVTGRTHQIRVHASYYKHAVLGDTKYQHDDSRDQWRQRGINGLCLHSRSIGFQAATGHQVTVVAPIPNPMHRFLVDAGCDPDIY